MSTQPTPTSERPRLIGKPELEEDARGRMSFFEHLVELRKRLINSALAIAVGMMIGVAAANKVFGFLARPMLAALRAAHFEDKLVYTWPIGAISLIINLGLDLGLVIDRKSVV